MFRMNHPDCPLAPRAGFSLIETIIAITLLGFGVLALAGAVTIVTRLVDQGDAATRAAFVAYSRMESLRGSLLAPPLTCAAAVGGPQSADAVSESWSATPASSSLVVLVEVTRWDGRTRATDTLSTALPC